MRSLSTLATLLPGLAIVFLAPAAKADCPHNNDDTHQHCVGGTPSTSNEFRFTGFTDDAPVNTLPNTIDGGQGMLDMHALCQDDFGPNSRMCTSEEFWQSPNAEAPAADAWLHFTYVGSGSDFSGIEVSASTLSCNAWTIMSAGNSGMVVTTAGKSATVLGCDTPRPVTCCEPIQ